MSAWKPMPFLAGAAAAATDQAMAAEGEHTGAVDLLIPYCNYVLSSYVAPD